MSDPTTPTPIEDEQGEVENLLRRADEALRSPPQTPVPSHLFGEGGHLEGFIARADALQAAHRIVSNNSGKQLVSAIADLFAQLTVLQTENAKLQGIYDELFVSIDNLDRLNAMIRHRAEQAEAENGRLTVKAITKLLAKSHGSEQHPCWCSSAWRSTAPSNHQDKCVATFNRLRAMGWTR